MSAPTGPRSGAYDAHALRQKLAANTLRLPGVERVPFLETLSVTSTAPLSVDDAEDDLAREKAFYAVALEAVGEAQRQLGGSIPFKRPDDYYADMLKSDEHMVRVKALLLKEKGRLEDAASKRKHRESAKFAKQVAAERTQERAKEKRVEQGVIRKWRRLHNQTGDDGEFPPELLDPNSTLRKQLEASSDLERMAGRKPRDATAKAPKITNAQRKAQKYGFGGKRGKHWKGSSADSAGEWEKDWSTKRNKKLTPAFKEVAQKNRPGKRARQSGPSKRPAKRPRTQ